MWLLAQIPVSQVDAVARGLESGPIRWVAALSILLNLGLLGFIARLHAQRVEELKAEFRELSSLAAKLERAVGDLDRAQAFVMAQLPKKKGGGSGPAPVLGPEPPSNPTGKLVLP